MFSESNYISDGIPWYEPLQMTFLQTRVWSPSAIGSEGCENLIHQSSSFAGYANLLKWNSGKTVPGQRSTYKKDND